MSGSPSASVKKFIDIIICAWIHHALHSNARIWQPEYAMYAFTLLFRKNSANACPLNVPCECAKILTLYPWR
jgi:hypothetical protein